LPILTSPYPLIEAFVGKRAKAGFFAPKANQYRAPIINLNPLNSHLLHTNNEFNSFSLEDIAFCRLALGGSGAATTGCRSHFEPYWA
jgi:hypothetical protein